MSWSNWLNPGGLLTKILNPGGIMDWAMPYVGPVSSAAGGIIGGIYGGPAGAGIGAGLGEFAGNQLGREVSTDPDYRKRAFSSDVLKESAIKGGIAGGIGYAGASLGGVQGRGFSPDTTGLSATAGGTDAAMGYGGGTESLLGTQELSSTGYPLYSSSGTGPDAYGQSYSPASTPNRSGGGWGLGNLGLNNNTLAMMGLGMGLNYLGASESNKAAEEYRNAVSWTPERTSAYMTALTNMANTAYGSEEEKRKRRMAEAVAGGGRGGGTVGAALERLGRERRETTAKALQQGLLETSRLPNYP